MKIKKFTQVIFLKYNKEGGEVMAKLAFSKLTLQKNSQVKEWSFNEQSIEVKQYLSIKERMDIAQLVIQQVIDFNNEFLNEFAFHMYMDLAIVFNYTNLSFTDKQKEDLYKLYDFIILSNTSKSKSYKIAWSVFSF